MKSVKGDLIKLSLNGEFDVIVHGCNCFNTMGGGIAKQIKLYFPEAYKVDLSTKKGDKSKLGTITYYATKNIAVVNAYTQYHYNPHTIQVDYNAIRKCFKEIKKTFGGKNLKFGIPKIGAGLAGGDWNIISKIIDEEMLNENLTLVIL